jgi:hypothetical protein
MKVFIGKHRYTHYSDIHKRYMNKKYGYYEWDENNNWFETILEILEDGLQTIYDKTINIIIDYLPSNHIRVRIDPEDTWSMDNTLSHIVAPMLRQLEKTSQGSPSVDDEDLPNELNNKRVDEDIFDMPDNHNLRWEWVLGEMIWAFEQKTRDDWEGDYYDYEDDPTNTEGLGLGIKITRQDREGAKSHQLRMSNGFRLFGKYYEGLWD